MFVPNNGWRYKWLNTEFKLVVDIKAVLSGGVFLIVLLSIQSAENCRELDELLGYFAMDQRPDYETLTSTPISLVLQLWQPF